MTFSLDFFDALRRMKERVPDIKLAPSPAVELPTPAAGTAQDRAVGAAGLALIKHFESCARRCRDGTFEAYPDPGTGGDPWTIGWGSTGRDIVRGTIWTQAECDSRLEYDLVRYASEVSQALGEAPTSEDQFDSLVSFHYNTGAIGKATLTKLHCSGQYEAAGREFGKWVKAGGKTMAGLVRRREAEARLYRQG